MFSLESELSDAHFLGTSRWAPDLQTECMDAEARPQWEDMTVLRGIRAWRDSGLAPVSPGAELGAKCHGTCGQRIPRPMLPLS